MYQHQHPQYHQPLYHQQQQHQPQLYQQQPPPQQQLYQQQQHQQQPPPQLYQQQQYSQPNTPSHPQYSHPPGPSQSSEPQHTEGIAVHVRVRPLNEFERSRGDHECVHCAEDGQTVRFVTQPTGTSRSQQGGAVKMLTFDSVLSGSSQVDVFRTLRTQALLQDALEGYAVTVFAYGQTGSGKTYTISGDDASEPNSEEAPPWSDPGPSGLLPRALGTLFATIAQWTREGRLSTCSVRASYLELYNEQINDLLNPESTNLQLRAHAQTGVFVENLLQAPPSPPAPPRAVARRRLYPNPSHRPHLPRPYHPPCTPPPPPPPPSSLRSTASRWRTR